MQWLKLKNILPKRVTYKIMSFSCNYSFSLLHLEYIFYIHHPVDMPFKVFNLEGTKTITRLLEYNISPKVWAIFWLPAEQTFFKNLSMAVFFFFFPLPPHGSSNSESNVNPVKLPSWIYIQTTNVFTSLLSFCFILSSILTSMIRKTF